MARKAAAVWRPTFPSKTWPVRKMSDGAERGFTLLEMVCVLALIALMAGVLLPFIPRIRHAPACRPMRFRPRRF